MSSTNCDLAIVRYIGSKKIRMALTIPKCVIVKANVINLRIEKEEAVKELTKRFSISKVDALLYFHLLLS